MAKKVYNERIYHNMKKQGDLSKFPKIKGYDFETDFNLDKFLKSFVTTGIQASNLASAITIINTMIREKTPIFFSFTSNMISSGLRDIISYLVKNNHVKVLCTTGGGIEEDAIKAHMPFYLGDFSVKGEPLFDSGVGRIGNIYTTQEHYAYFEFFIRDVFEILLKQQKRDKKTITPSKICSMMGKLIGEKKNYNKKDSYLYWAYKNNIPVYSPGIIDGTIGDIAYYFRKEHPEFVIDVVADHVKIIDSVINSQKTAAIVLGGGISKHYILNANIFKDGLDYAVYVSTAIEHDASDSGGNPEEAVTWAKIKPDAPRVKVFADASIVFPLIVAGSFAKTNK